MADDVAAQIASSEAAAGVSWVPGKGFVVNSQTASPSSGAGLPPGVTPAAGQASGWTWNGSNWQYAAPTASGLRLDAKGNIIYGAGASATPVSQAALAATAGLTTPSLADPGSSAVATGFPMMLQSLQLLLAAQQEKRASVDQGITLAQLFGKMGEVSPSQTADLATRLGMPSFEPNFDWTKSFLAGGDTGTFGGQVGSQNVQLPFSFNGQQLTFLRNNSAVAAQVADLAKYFGRPDILSNSQDSLVPASSALVNAMT